WSTCSGPEPIMLSPHAEWVTRVDILLTCAPREKRCEKKVGPRGSPRPHGSGGWGVVRAIVAGIAGVFLALTASAHDPEGEWDDQVRANDRWHDREVGQMLRPPNRRPTGHAVLWYNDIGGTFLIYCCTPSRET